MNELYATFIARKGELFSSLIKHLEISSVSLLIALFIALPLGIVLTRNKKISQFVIGLVGVFQTIPSLALLGLLIPLVGIGTTPAIIALVIYALLPILQNVCTGINGVDKSLIEAAQGLGMSNKRLLFKIELPLAMPVIMAGIRTATVLIIGTATIASLIGAGGLGDLITVGMSRNNANLILVGAIPAALLALLFDFILRKIEKMSFKRAIYSVAVLVTIIIVLIGSSTFLTPKKADITIGGKLGSEPEILINMYKLLIEEHSNLTVELKSNLGGTTFLFNALQSGSIDIYPEFTGTAIVDLVKEQPVSTDSQATYTQAKEGLFEQFEIMMLEPMQFNNTYALAVAASFVEKYELQTISDLLAIQDTVKAGFTPEFPEREDGYIGIQNLYNIDFSSVSVLQPELRYTAINSGEVNVVDAYSTDSEITRYNLTVLEDDKNLFPTYQGAPVLKQELLEDYPELEEILNKLSGLITDDEMREMNYEVAVESKKAKEVAKEFLQANDLIE